MADNKIHRKIPWDEEAYFKQRKKKAKLPENTTYAYTASEIIRRDMQFLALLLWIPLDTMVSKEKSFGISPEVPMNLHRAYSVMVKNASKEAKTVSTRKLLKDADTCLKATNSPDARGAVLAAAWVILKLADEQRIRDPDSQIVLTSAGIIAEAQADGSTGPWRFNADTVTKAGERLWSRANLAGYLLSMGGV